MHKLMFSIIVVSLNAEETIERTLESVLSQTEKIVMRLL